MTAPHRDDSNIKLLPSWSDVGDGEPRAGRVAVTRRVSSGGEQSVSPGPGARVPGPTLKVPLVKAERRHDMLADTEL